MLDYRPMENDSRARVENEVSATEKPLWMKARDNVVIQGLSRDLIGLQEIEGLKELEEVLHKYFWVDGIPYLQLEIDETGNYWSEEFADSLEYLHESLEVKIPEDKTLKTKIKKILKIDQEFFPEPELPYSKIEIKQPTSIEGIFLATHGYTLFLSSQTHSISPRADGIRDLGDGRFIFRKKLLDPEFDSDQIATIRVLNLQERGDVYEMRRKFEELQLEDIRFYNDKTRKAKEYEVQEKLLFETLKEAGIDPDYVEKSASDNEDDISITRFTYRKIPIEIRLAASSRLQFVRFPDEEAENGTNYIAVSSDNISWGLPIALALIERHLDGNREFLDDLKKRNLSMDIFVSGPESFSTSLVTAGPYGSRIYNREHWQLNERNEIMPQVAEFPHS